MELKHKPGVQYGIQSASSLPNEPQPKQADTHTHTHPCAGFFSTVSVFSFSFLSFAQHFTMCNPANVCRKYKSVVFPADGSALCTTLRPSALPGRSSGLHVLFSMKDCDHASTLRFPCLFSNERHLVVVN